MTVGSYLCSLRQTTSFGSGGGGTGVKTENRKISRVDTEDDMVC